MARFERTQCESPTLATRFCKRLATRFYLDAEGYVVKALCSMHADGSGPAKYLRPHPWSYSRRVDRFGRDS